MAKAKRITWMAVVRYPGDVNHVFTHNAPDSETQSPEPIDAWVKGILTLHGTHNAHCYISKVVFYISG